jgi:hypothetical protein
MGLPIVGGRAGEDDDEMDGGSGGERGDGITG